MTLHSAFPACVAMLLAIHVNFSSAAWHDERAGNEVRAHHVHLSGHSADNERQRQLLWEDRQACAETNPLSGLPVAPLPAGGIPPIIHQAEVDIYYADGRTATVTFQRRYSINRVDCGVKTTDRHSLRLFGKNVSETCTVDLIKRRANGTCLPASSKGKKQGIEDSPGVDLSKVPPHLREQAKSAFDKIIQRKRQVPVEESLPATGEFRTIAGLSCRVHRHATLPLEKCIAHPESTFPIPPSVFHGGLPGLLLYISVVNQLPALTASEVHLDIGLSAEAFAVPADIRLKAGKQ